jgi:hypothetical protein
MTGVARVPAVQHDGALVVVDVFPAGHGLHWRSLVMVPGVLT